jgi:hypothetical protein
MVVLAKDGFMFFGSQEHINVNWSTQGRYVKKWKRV